MENEKILDDKTKIIVAKEIKAILILFIIMMLIRLFFILNPSPWAKDYYTKGKYGGQLEQTYAYPGQYEVASFEQKAKNSLLGKYKIWYPKNFEGKAPAIVYCNGSYGRYTLYEPYLEHFASWGFIVIGNNDLLCGSSKSNIKGLKLLLELNEDKDSELFEKLDVEKIGIMGHSRGGVACFNAVNNFEEGKYFKTIFAISPVYKGLATFKFCPYEYEGVDIPTVIVSSLGSNDANYYIPLDRLNEMYDNYSAEEIIVARRNDCSHGGMPNRSSGYATAWFLYKLCGDEKAKTCFYGENSEINNNKYWQDIKIKNEF